MDMSFVYSIAQEKKAQLDTFKKIVGIISIPIVIEGYAWVKALQTGISLINCLCTVDDVMKLSDKLFQFRGPVIISDVYDKVYSNMYLNKEKGIEPESKLIAEYDSFDRIAKMKALEDFLKVKNTIGEQIKIIKEPVTTLK